MNSQFHQPKHVERNSSDRVSGATVRASVVMESDKPRHLVDGVAGIVGEDADLDVG